MSHNEDVTMHPKDQNNEKDTSEIDNESGIVASSSVSLADVNNGKITLKRELSFDSISSSSSTRVKRLQRNYRPRIMESSSEDESTNINTTDKSNVDNSANLAGSSSNNQISVPQIDSCNNDQIMKDESENTSSVNNYSNISCSSNTGTENSINEPNSSILQDSGALDVSQMETSQSSTPISGSMTVNSDEASQATASPARRARRFFSNFPLDSDSDDSDDGTETAEGPTQKVKLEETIAKELDAIFSKRMPKHKWNSFQAVIDRQYGMPGNRQSGDLFSNRFYDSLHVAQRLELVNTLDFHTGCTNALNFNDSGDLLVSTSDDLQIAIWDWTKGKMKFAYNSGHRNNVFQCKFLPLSGNTHIASCARDGQVRLAEISSTGVVNTRRLAKHSRSAHKLAVRLSTPYEMMSSGEDAFVYNIDIRKDQPDKIVLVKDIHGNRVPLYSIHQHPLDDNQFCVSGQDEYVRMYDRRIISPFGPPALKYCPPHLVDKKGKSNITCAVYSNNGDAILASYNEDIYLFDTNLSEGAAPSHRYSGHRNNSTVKGVNFFSPSSKFVVSGSDCGNIFVWDRDTEAIVNCMPGDKNGVVNVLEPHPHLPVMATSGLDNEIKIWLPTLHEDPKLSTLNKLIRSNVRQRLQESSEDNQMLESQMLMVLFQHLSRNASLRGTRRSGSGAGPALNLDEDDEDGDLGLLDSSDSSSDDDDSDDSDSSRRRDVVQFCMNLRLRNK